MLKIRNRIAILYSILIVALIVICLSLLFIFTKLNVYNNPIVSSIMEDQGEDTVSDEMINSNQKNVFVIRKGIDNGDIAEGSSEEQKNISFDENSFEKLIKNIIYHRLFIIVPIVIAIVLAINFLLSKKYASFALTPLIKFTNRIKKQKNIKNIEFVEVPKVKDEIYDLTEAYNDVLGKIKVSYENMQRLNSYTSHELRNSLAVLRAKIELGDDSKEITNYIDRLNGVIGDILAMSTTRLSDSKEDVDLALVCAKVIDEYSEVFKNFKFNIPEDGVDTIKGREVWIERCITNLIDNAIKYQDIKKDNNEINIRVFQDDKIVIVEVYDNGIGMQEDELDKIFIPYYGTKSRKSTGIGLAYVKHVMELHNGHVEVESKKNKYSKFSLIFKK